MMNTSTSFYTLIDHTADLRIGVHGKGPRELFGNAARALMDLMIGNASGGETIAIGEVALEGNDFADLMVRWLGEILYLFAAEGMMATSFHIDELEPNRLRATVRGVRFKPEIHEILTDIKAVTYHEIEVAPRGGRWEAEVTFDV